MRARERPAGRDAHNAVCHCRLHPANTPCVTAQWVVGAARVLAGGAPVIIQTSQAVCVPTGQGLRVSNTQTKGLRDMNIDFPYHFDSRGRTAEVDYDAHIRDLIEEVLFTAPGERVNGRISAAAFCSWFSRQTATSSPLPRNTLSRVRSSNTSVT